ncbi:DGAT2D [Symbiodinium sp. CCMP2592]|nr:DGAT2D [Symbiodinium sp. CCMP2592]
MLALGGSMQPHMGWCKSLLTAVSMFAVLVQVDQRLAAAAVFLVSFSSALLARTGPALLLAAVASWMTLLNARRRVCAPSPKVQNWRRHAHMLRPPTRLAWAIQFLEFQYQGYKGYHQSPGSYSDKTDLPAPTGSAHFRGSEVRFDDAGALGDEKGGKGSGSRFFACHPHGRSLSQSHSRSCFRHGSRRAGILSVGFCSNAPLQHWMQTKPTAGKTVKSREAWRLGLVRLEVVGHCNYLIDPTLRNKGLLAKFFLDAFEGPHGAIRDTRAVTIQNLMEKGESISMTPGAYQEATCFSHGFERVALRQRKGFVKYCLRYGYRLHPVYTFGESETYFTLGGFDKLRLWLNGKGIPTVCFWGLPSLASDVGRGVVPAAPAPAPQGPPSERGKRKGKRLRSAAFRVSPLRCSPLLSAAPFLSAADLRGPGLGAPEAFGALHAAGETARHRSASAAALPRLDRFERRLQVDEWHGKYMEALRELFERHKAEAGKPSAVLEIL